MSAEFFSPNYETARGRFRELVASKGGRSEHHEIGQNGPDGSPLTIDIGIFGAPEAKTWVVLSSGTHGVEGFFGSAVQLACMNKLLSHFEENTNLGLILIHALNPYGFAYIRRVNEHNVDLNRNFLPPTRPYEGADPAYGIFDALLNPQNPPGGIEFFLLRTIYHIARQGMPKLKNSLVSGQYDYEKGLFFGGKGPSASHTILEENFPRWLEGAEEVIHLDFHTGLGAWGTYVLGVCEPASPEEVAWTKSVFDERYVQGLDPSGVLYEIHGEFGAWCKQRLNSIKYHAVLAEFGTYPSLKVLAALRDENRAHHWDSGNASSLLKSKGKLKEAFAPKSEKWRSLVVDKGLAIVEQAVAAVHPNH